MPPEAKILHKDGICISFASDSPCNSAWGTGREGESGKVLLHMGISQLLLQMQRHWELKDCPMWRQAFSIQHVPKEGDEQSNVPKMLYQRDLEILQTLLILPQVAKRKAHFCKIEITFLIPPGWGRKEILHTEYGSFSSPKTSAKISETDV